ncbi:hypothetical protein Tsubulata_014157 [Turnera subulata]|uniref:TCP domain-containing protein n=1 Tax=Turnera subulata TaxID=218843 RepID=A0A9Q0J283_9ROSI|nr:hypothetical protein Tsubulata_014157 [Turnera subulata]
METDEIHSQPCKFSRVGNGRNDTTKIGLKGNGDHQFPDDEEDGDLKRPNPGSLGSRGGDVGIVDGSNRLRGWHSSRIIRVSRASGGKDRHSKVWTSKGLRDRRVRLSVTTAIQFYDLQDRLGYDQPSKAVEWLIKKAADAIAELPSLNTPFPDTPKQLSDEKRGTDIGGTEQGFDSADLELEDPSLNQSQNQHLSLSKSACSSTSETSKGSGLSLARSDLRVNRVKARERARERTAKEKEKDNDPRIANQQNINPISHQNSTFTELLTGGISSVNHNHNNNHHISTTTSTSPSGSEANFLQKAAAARQWPLTPMDYFSTGLLGPSTSRTAHQSSGYSGQIQLGNSIPQGMTMIPPFNVSGENNQEQLQHFPFDHLIPVATAQSGPGGDYNLNFTISSGLAGFNRGTLQSNSSSPSLLPHLQRFSSSPLDGSTTNVPFFIGAAPQAMENHHHHQFPPGLQLCYGDGTRHSDHKGKGKN